VFVSFQDQSQFVLSVILLEEQLSTSSSTITINKTEIDATSYNTPGRVVRSMSIHFECDAIRTVFGSQFCVCALQFMVGLYTA
jgi:hypothetical protein